MNDQVGRASPVGALGTDPQAETLPQTWVRGVRWLLVRPAWLVVPLFVLWSAAHLDGFSWDYDEGIHVYIAWLVQQGHPLYAQTFSPYTPGFIMPLAAAFSLFGPSVAVARILAVLLAACGVLGVMLSAREIADEEPGATIAQVVAAGLLCLTAAFVQWSRAAMSDLPAAAVGALAVGLGLVYMRTGRARWLAAAEIVIAYALWIKLIAVGPAAALGLAVLLRLRQEPAALRRVVVVSLLVGLSALLPLLLFDVRGLYDQALYFHVLKRVAFDQTWLDRAQILADFISANGILSAAALLGAFAIFGQRAGSARQRQAWLIAVAWAGATAASLLFQSPLFANHHPVVLSLPLAALGGVGGAWALRSLSDSLRWLRRKTPPSAARAGLSLAATLLCLGLAAAGSAQYPAQLTLAVAPPFQPAAEEAQRMLAALTGPNELVVSDAQMIAFRSQRQAPPALADTSSARLASGNLTDEQLIAQTEASGANSVLFWSGRLESAGAFAGWVKQNYRLVHTSLQTPNAPYQFWMRRPQPEHPLEAQFGGAIALVGYDLNRRSGLPLTASGPPALTLYFQRTGPIERSYTIFTHLLDSSGSVVAQSDRPPLAGRYPTDQWRANEWIVDEFSLSTQSTLAAGEYSLELGFYAPDTLQRLPVLAGGVAQPDNRLQLGPIQFLPAAAP